MKSRLLCYFTELYTCRQSSCLLVSACVSPLCGSAWVQRVCLLTLGLVSSADEVACADPETCLKVCSNPSGCSDIAYPKLVLELLPTGNVRSSLNGVPWRTQKGRPWLGPDLREGQDGRAAGGNVLWAEGLSPRARVLK